MDRDSANASRLRVNRMALIQQLDAQDLVPKLARARILSMDYDVPYINQGTSRIDRARRLVDCLLAPTSTDAGTPRHDRSGNWYLKFRSALLENTAAYGDLVVALDNTIIRTPEFAQHVSEAFADKTNVPRSQEFRDKVNKDLLRTSEAQADSEPKKSPSTVVNQEQITKIEFDPYARNKILIEGNFQKVIDNLTYHSQVPERLLQQLSVSDQAYDREQLEAEKQAYDDMRRLELMNNLIKKEPSLASQTIFDTPMIDTLLSNGKHHHHFYKYFNTLSTIYGVYLDREFYQSFRRAIDQTSDLLAILDKGFQLYDFLYNYGRFELCRQIIEHIVQALTKQVKQEHEHQSATWTYLFRACCALIQVHNQGLEMKEAWARIEAAHEIIDNLKAIDLEIPSSDYASLYFSASQTAFEDANFDACIQYCYRGLKAADKNNHLLIVDLLCSLAQGLTSKWIMNKAQATVIMAVQYAAKYCGRSSPKYVYALQQLVHFSNEFVQDQSSVALAEIAFERARTVYGYESLAVAHAHRALSKSLITTASINYSRQAPHEQTTATKTTYLQHAHQAYRIAQDWFGVEDRVRLFPFKMSFAHALQARVSANIPNDKESYFHDALELLDDCLAVAQEIFGTMSFKVAQVHRLRSATYLSKRMYDEAEQQLSICQQIYKLCLPPHSFHYLLSKASLGLIYKQRGSYARALPLFQSIAELLDTKTQSFRWINMCLESLIECYSHLKDNNDDDEQGDHGRLSPSRTKTAADKVRAELYEWRRTNVKRPDLIHMIDQEATRSLHQFLHDSTKFQETTDRVHALMRTQQKSKTHPSIPTPTNP